MQATGTVFALIVGLSAAMHIKPLVDVTSDFYDLCTQSSVHCTGAWTKSSAEAEDCLETRNCTFAVAMETIDDNNKYVFHMFATNSLSYISLGFSVDTKMGEDAVVACKNNGTEVTGELSLNVGHRNQKEDSNYDLIIHNTTVEDGTVYCKFSLSDPLKFARHVNNNTDSEFYIMAAAGPLSSEGALSHHTGYAVSNEKWPISFQEEVAPFDSFYDLCAEDSVKCAGAWVKSETEVGACLESRNCTKAVAMETTDDGYVFHMLATGNFAYTAFGFSKDQDMGDDSVVACVKNDNVISVSLSYNEGYNNKKAESNEGVTLHNSTVVDGIIYCKVSLSDTLKYARYVEDNSDNDFYIIGAAGRIEGDGGLGHHSVRLFSNEKWSLTSSGAFMKSSIFVAFAVVIMSITF